MRTLALAVVIAIAPAIAHAGGLPSLTKGSPYVKARSTLLRSGFKPVRSAENGCSIGREEICKKYPEAEACSGTGLGNCLFVWRQGGRVIEVSTVGEIDLKVAAVKCRSGCR